MTFDLIDIIPIVLLIFAGFGLKPVTPISSFNEEYLSVDTGRTYRGFFCLAVIIHHLAGRSESGWIFRDFVQVGYLSVAMFFFLSGYGVFKSYIRSEKYREGFLTKRLSKVLIPYTVLNIIYRIVNLFRGEDLTLKIYIEKLVTGHPVVLYSWFVTNIILFYLLTKVLMVLCGKHYHLMIILSLIGIIIYDIFCVRMEYARAWYNANHLLVVGMLWALHEEKIIKLIKSHYWIWLVAVWALFLILFRFRKDISHAFEIEGLGLSLLIITSTLFVISMITLNMKFHIGNGLIRKMGDISLETYLVQGLFIFYLRDEHIMIENEFVWATVSLIGSILLGWLIHSVIDLGTNLLTKKKTAL